ncbi:MAG: hypothetical protein M0P55_03580 [Clostridiales bacterium]|nr:hypothetical protein [Clostridiales bacterium]
MTRQDFTDRITRTFAAHGFDDLELVRDLTSAVAEEIDSNENINDLIQLTRRTQMPKRAGQVILIMHKLAALYGGA